MKIIFLILCGLIVKITHAQSNMEDSNIIISNRSKMYVLMDSNYTIISFTKTMYTPFKNTTPTSLEKNEIVAVERLLDDCIDEYNQKQPVKTSTDGRKYEPVLINLTSYKRQYVPVINNKGEKEVWVNCFRNAYDQDWKNKLISVRGGGTGFFNVKVNLNQKRYYEFKVNSLK